MVLGRYIGKWFLHYIFGVHIIYLFILYIHFTSIATENKKTADQEEVASKSNMCYKKQLVLITFLRFLRRNMALRDGENIEWQL